MVKKLDLYSVFFVYYSMIFELFIVNPFMWVLYFFIPFIIWAWIDTKKA